MYERDEVQLSRAKRRSAAVHDVPGSREHAFDSHTGRGYREVMSGDDLQIWKVLMFAFPEQQTIVFNGVVVPVKKQIDLSINCA